MLSTYISAVCTPTSKHSSPSLLPLSAFFCLHALVLGRDSVCACGGKGDQCIVECLDIDAINYFSTVSNRSRLKLTSKFNWDHVFPDVF